MWLMIAISMSSGLMASVVGYLIGLRAKELNLESQAMRGVIELGGIRYTLMPAVWMPDPPYPFPPRPDNTNGPKNYGH